MEKLNLEGNTNMNLKYKVFLISRILNLCDEKIQMYLMDLEEKNSNNIDEIKNQLYNFLLENSLKYLDIKDKNNKVDFSNMIYDNNFFNILKFTIENYDKKFSFFNSFIDSAFYYILNSNCLKEQNERKILKLKEYLKLFWYFNTFIKGKVNEEISDLLFSKLSSTKNITLIKNILKLIIENLFDVY